MKPINHIDSLKRQATAVRKQLDAGDFADMVELIELLEQVEYFNLKIEGLEG